jgi:hypothetical protein
VTADLRHVPSARLGETTDDGIAAGIFALVERGIDRRPELAGEMRGRIELRFEEQLDPVRLEFGADEVLVEDGAWRAPDLVIAGRLPHIVHLTTAPMLGGVPNPIAQRGRAALSRLASGRLRIEGDRALGRKFVRLLEV